MWMIARCRAEIAAVEAQIRPSRLARLVPGAGRRSAELRLLQRGGSSASGAPSLATVRASAAPVAGHC
jgi:hypothetical protein